MEITENNLMVISFTNDDLLERILLFPLNLHAYMRVVYNGGIGGVSNLGIWELTAHKNELIESL